MHPGRAIVSLYVVPAHDSYSTVSEFNAAKVTYYCKRTMDDGGMSEDSRTRQVFSFDGARA